MDETAAPREFEVMYEGDDGWSDWVHPEPGYRMKCCGCGLVHDVQFEVAANRGSGVLNPGESSGAVIIMRARRLPA